MINIFKRKTKIKDIELFELKVAEVLYSEFPQIREHLRKSKLKIYFYSTGITLLRQNDSIIESNKSSKICFELSGIYLLERKTQRQKEIKLFYQRNVLHQISVEKPETFYKDFDLNSITKKETKIREIVTENPGLKIVSRILSSLNKQQLALLYIEDTFEIEINDKFYYTIVDMENGNYIAVDKKGKIFRLNHNARETEKEIFKNAYDFLSVYNGEKSELEIYFE